MIVGPAGQLVPSPGLTGVQEPGEVTVVISPDGQSEVPGTTLVTMLVMVPAGGQVDWPPVGATGVDPVPVHSLHVVASRGNRATGFALASKLFTIREIRWYVNLDYRTSNPSLQAGYDGSWSA